jgi:hypothetical protein
MICSKVLPTIAAKELSVPTVPIVLPPVLKICLPTPEPPALSQPINCMTSPSAGKRPRLFLENSSFPSTTTSYTPPEEAINSTSAPHFSLSSASSPEARGL